MKAQSISKVSGHVKEEQFSGHYVDMGLENLHQLAQGHWSDVQIELSRAMPPRVLILSFGKSTGMAWHWAAV